MSKLLISLFLILSLKSFSQNSFEKWNFLYDSLYKISKNDSSLKVAFDMNKWILQNEGDTSLNYANTFRFIGNCYYRLNKNDSAIYFFKFSLKTLENQNRKNNPDYANSLNNLGVLYNEVGDFINAENYYKQALAIRKNLFGEFSLDYAWSLNSLGVLYNDLGNYERAKVYYNQALEIRKKLLGDNHPDYASSLNNLAVLYNDIGDFTNAQIYYNQALEIEKNILGENHPDYAMSLNNLGTLNYEIGDFKRAEEYYKKSLEIRKNVLGVNHVDFAASLNNLGALYEAIGDYKSAEIRYKQSLEINKKTLGENSFEYARGLINLGNLFNIYGDYKNSEIYEKHALEIQKRLTGIFNLQYAAYLNSIAHLYSNMKNNIKTEFYLMQMLEIYQNLKGEKLPGYASLLNNLGILYLDMGNYRNSEIYFKKTLDLKRNIYGEKSTEFIDIQNNLAIMYDKSKRADKAFEIYKKTYSKITKQVIDNFQWLSELQKEAYWKKLSPFFDEIGSFSNTNYAKFHEVAALNYNASLFMKSRLLENKINSDKNNVQLNDSSLNELIYRKKLIAKLESEGKGGKNRLEVLYKESDSIDKKLTLSWPEYFEQKKNLSISWNQVQQNIDSNEAAIEFVKYMNREDSQYYYNALLIRKWDKYPVLIHLCKEDLLKSIKPEIGYRSYYRLIWKPLEGFLKGITTIYYSPVGELNNVPFHAISLPTKKDGESKFVIDRYVLHQLTSTRYLAMELKKNTNVPISKSIVLVGGVNYDYLPSKDEKTYIKSQFSKKIDRAGHSFSNKLDYLEGTKTEVEQINNIVNSKKWSVELMENDEAKEERIIGLEGTNSKSILHFATHGFVFPEYNYSDTTILKNSFQYNYRYSLNPMVRSGLMLTGGNWAWTGNDTLEKLGVEQNGILTALEVSQLDLKKTKLVVLSACETGLGKIEGSEGTFGLKRGFKLAGVEQILVSLWPVPDKETMELMTTFYKDLSITLDPIKSFEKAQKSLRMTYPDNPENWAGFVLVR